MASIIKSRLVALPEGEPALWPTELDDGTSRPINKYESSLADAVAAKMEDGNIRAAVRLLCSNEKPSPLSDATYVKLQDKHPRAPSDRQSSPPIISTTVVSVDEDEVLAAIRLFSAGSSGGPDGFRPKHLLDLVSCKESGSELLSALTGFINLLLSGTCHPDIIPILFGGRLIALDKHSGDIRPIAVGFTLRRLASKCVNSFATNKLASYFSPHQLGAGVKGGCEAAVHATRRFLNSLPQNSVIAKLDFSNAFNCLHRDVMLSEVMRQCPEIYNYCRLSYNQSSILWFGDRIIHSQEGPQQGDPLGPLLFCIALHPLLSSLKSSLNIGYMDDVTLGGHEDVVEKDVAFLSESGASIGLHLNINKCELIHAGDYIPGTSNLRSFQSVSLSKATLLGAPLLTGHGLDDALDDCCTDLSSAINRLKSIESHDALILLRSCFCAPKVQHILRCTPCNGHPALGHFDSLLRSGLSAIVNSDLSDISWLQACLPVREGGLGIRRTASLALSAFLASAAGTRDLQDQILVDSGCAFIPKRNSTYSFGLLHFLCLCRFFPPLPSSRNGKSHAFRPTEPQYLTTSATATI